MKRKTLIASIALLFVSVISLFVISAISSPGTLDIMNYIAGLSDKAPEGADVNGDGGIDVLDAIASKPGVDLLPRLDSLEAEGAVLTPVFSPGVFEYTAVIPEGRPVIPLVEAESNGSEVSVTQAFIPNGKTDGTSVVNVSNEYGSRTYTVTFKKSADKGFVLQYDDRYDISSLPELEGKTGITYTSSAPSCVSVDENGILTAKARTETPVTVSAKKDGAPLLSLTIDKVVKARINLFFITGQSNAQGCYSSEAWSDSEKEARFAAEHAQIEEIGVSGAVYGFDVFPRSENKQVYSLRKTLYDLNEHAKQGFEPSFGKYFYNLSGEKVVFLQVAYSGSAIEAWIDPDRHTEAGTYASAKYNYYNETQSGYSMLLNALGDDFEIVRSCNLWWHGGTAMSQIYNYETSTYITSSSPDYDSSRLITDQKYYDYYMMIHNDMIEDFGIEYDFLVLNRVPSGAASAESLSLQLHTDINPIREAQIALTTTNDDIIMVSRIGDWARQITSTDKETYGYGFVGENGHYTQLGHNEYGKDFGQNTFKHIFGQYDLSSAYVDLLAENGRKRLSLEDTVEITSGDVYRSAALAEPIAAGLGITWSSSDESVASVDMFGKVKAISEGNAVITAACENGMSASYNVSVKPKQLKQGVDYLWDFNDLKSSLDKNDLTVSDYTVAQGAESNYSLTNGMMTQSNKLANKKHPDFMMERPIELNSETDWYIEWRAKLTRHCILMGNPTPDDASASLTGAVYLAYDVNFNSSGEALYPLRMTYGNKNLLIGYGEYAEANLEMNTWRLSYSASTNEVTLFIEQNGELVKVNSAKMGVYDYSISCLLGRFAGGKQGFSGELDYVRVHVASELDDLTTYLWDFANLKEFNNKNDLRISDYAVEKGSDANYTLKDGIYSVKSGTASGNRPDFSLQTPPTFDSEHSWSVEWRAKLSSSSVLFGCDTAADQTTIPKYIYLAYTADFGGADSYSLRFNYGSGSVYLPYGSYKDSNKSWNTWKLDYDCGTNVLSLKIRINNTMTEVASAALTDFSVTVDTLFGRFSEASTGFNGSCDWIKVTLWN